MHGPCRYGHPRELGGTGTPGITGGCRCPKFGTPRSKMPVVMDEAELEIEEAVKTVQRALDVLCDVVKRRLRERRGDATDIDPSVVLGRRRKPEILQQPPPPKESSIATSSPPLVPTKPKAVETRANGILTHAPAAGLSPCERAILTVLVQHGARTAHQIAILAGYSESGSFSGALTDLRAEGLIERGTPVHITAAGRQIVGPVSSLPQSPDALLAYWAGELEPCAAKILYALRRGPLTSAEAAERTGYSESGSFNGALTKLRALGLIVRGQPMRLAPELL